MAGDTYLINGVEILTPSTFRWMPQSPLDVQGDNRPIYSGVRNAELKWILMSYSDWSNIQDLYDLVRATGSHAVYIPAFPTAPDSAYAMGNYSGVHLAEPAIGPFFCEYPSSVTLLIGNIVVE